MSEVALRIIKIDGEPTAAGVIGAKHAAELLQCSVNTVKNKARDGKIGYFYVNYNEPGCLMLFYKRDVIILQKKKIKEQEKNIMSLKKGQSSESK